MTKKEIVLDTNVLMSKPHVISELIIDNKIVIPMIVLEEIDNLNHSVNSSKSFYARRGIKEINKFLNHENMIIDDKTYGILFKFMKNDNKILRVAKRRKGVIFTLDLAMNMKAVVKKIETYKFKDDNSDKDYKGYRIWELDLSNECDEFLLSSLYSGTFDLDIDDFFENEYLIIKNCNTGEFVDAFKYKDSKFESVRSRNLTSKFFGKVKERDIFQRIAIDNLHTNNLAVVKGRAGSGKTFISLAYCLSEIECGKYDKIVFFVNPSPAKNAVELGFRPGTTNEKLISSSVGVCLSAKFGGIDGLLRYINDGYVEMLPMVDLRGYDSGGQKVIIYILESQNLDVELMKLALTRVNENAKVILDGDDKTQVDLQAYAINNGMKRVGEIYRGCDLYGEVELKSIYRGRIAELADLM